MRNGIVRSKEEDIRVLRARSLGAKPRSGGIPPKERRMKVVVIVMEEGSMKRGVSCLRVLMLKKNIIYIREMVVAL